MTTPPPTPEAVEAALAYIKKPSDPKLYLVAVTSKDERPSWSDHDGMTVSARILATEVERLRAQADASDVYLGRERESVMTRPIESIVDVDSV